MCLKDWDFLVMDSIFAVHKQEKELRTRTGYFSGSEDIFQKQSAFIENTIEIEYQRLFGNDSRFTCKEFNIFITRSFGSHSRCKRKSGQVSWSEVHSWEREFIAKLGMNITLSEE